MTTSSYFLLVALGLLLYVCQSSFGNEHTCDPYAAPHPQGKCGGDLVDYVLKMCDGRTYSPGKKRGRASPLWKRRGFLSMLKARAKRNEAFPLQRSGQKGIACECCQNHCTDVEINKYCAEPK
uniref:Insulin-related protein n=1 Tax=Conus ermineus TaxID=55423 RepID=A0A346CJF9_CONER|nr:insulin-related protein [Conus ermineus]